MTSRSPRTLSAAQVSGLINRSTRWVYEQAAAGNIPGITKPRATHRGWVFDKEEIVRWWSRSQMDHQRQPPTQNGDNTLRALSRGRPRYRDAIIWARELYERGYEQHIVFRSLDRHKGIKSHDALIAIKETTEYMSIGILYNEHGHFARIRKRMRGPLSSLDAAKKAFAEMSASAELMMHHAPKVRSMSAMLPFARDEAAHAGVAGDG